MKKIIMGILLILFIIAVSIFLLNKQNYLNLNIKQRNNTNINSQEDMDSREKGEIVNENISEESEGYRQEELKNEKNIDWVVVDDLLLGGTMQEEWASVEDIQDWIKGGEMYNLYDFNNKIGEGSGGKIELVEPCETQTIEIDTKDQFNIALTGQWNPVPRRITHQSLENENYKKILSKILGEYGIKDQDINILQNYRVDLEGDGVDEVLINASNLDYNHPIPPMNKGDYSIIIVRKIIEGEVQNIVLSKCIGVKDVNWNEDESYDLQIVSRVEGIMDLNGDGIMEIIIGSKYYEGYGYTVYEIRGREVYSVLGNGCGV